MNFNHSMGVFLIILLILALLWPYIMRWMRGYLMRKAEDRLRQMMGAPTRQEERRQRRQQRDDSRRGDTRPRGSNPHPAQAMKEVAEDVRYTEIIDYSESTSTVDVQEENGTRRRVYHEEQVEDVKFTEIKNRK